MTYTRVRNQQLSITFKPVSPSSDTLFSHSKELFKDIESLLKEKYPNEFYIKSQEKVGIDFFTKKLPKIWKFSIWIHSISYQR